MNTYLPYVVSVLCALIAGFTSYAVARKQAKADMQKLEKQYELDLDKEREKFAMEKERMELEHKHQLELMEKEMEKQLGTEFVSTLTKEYMRSSAGQAQMRASISKKRHK